MKKFVKVILDFVGSASNFLFYVAELYFFLFFVYVFISSISPSLGNFLSPLYIEILKNTDVSIRNNMSEVLVFAVFSFMLLFIRNFLVLTYDNFCTNTLSRFNSLDADLRVKEVLSNANTKKKVLDELKFIVTVKINFEIFKSFFDDENEQTEEEIISVKKNILTQVSSILSEFQVLKSATSNDLYSAVILNINNLYDLTLKLNNLKMHIPDKYGSSSIRIDLTILIDEFYDDDNFQEKVFLMKKIPNIIKKSVFILTTNLENTLDINSELKEKYTYHPIGTYSLSNEIGESREYDLTIIKFKNI